jgi:SHS2 domain-containing protein
MSTAGWEHLEVEAGVGVRGRGPTRGEAYAQATLGVFALIVDPGQVQARERREVRAQADTPEALLVAWIDECLYVHEIEGFVVRAVELTTCTDALAHGLLHGEPLDSGRHRVGTVVKGCHQTRVGLRERVWEAQVTVEAQAPCL